MISRRHLVGVVGAFVAAPRHFANAQLRPATRKVGFVALSATVKEYVEALELGLRENGRPVGASVQVIARFADGDVAKMRRMVDELVSENVQVFVTAGGNASRIIQERSPQAAIVVASIETLETAGVVGRLTRPQGNVTGFGTLAEEVLEKRIELLREVVPGLRGIVAFTTDTNRSHAPLGAAVRQACARAGMEARILAMPEVAALQDALLRARTEGAGAWIYLRDFRFDAHRHEIAAAARAARLPAIFDDIEFVEAGGLMSYGVNRADLFRRSAAYVVKVWDGASPLDLPIQIPTKFDFAIGLSAARSIGVEFPASIVQRADLVWD